VGFFGSGRPWARSEAGGCVGLFILSDGPTLGIGTQLELELLACFCVVGHGYEGKFAAAYTALVRALDIAEHLKAAPMQLFLFHALHKWQVRSGDFRGLRELTDGFFAITCFFAGDHHEVRRHARIALTAPVHLSKLNVASFGHLHKVMSVLARNLWMVGYPEQAMATSEEAVQEAENLLRSAGRAAWQSRAPTSQRDAGERSSEDRRARTRVQHDLSPTRQSARTSRPDLHPIFGVQTRDLVAAANLLQQLRSSN
jgi:hypothetical protein